MTEAIDTRELRNALGCFATGVTIVTAQVPEELRLPDTVDGSDNVGLTVNSFSSVSMEPPLILWSLQRSSGALDVFRAASHFAVNVLAADQIELSNRFATTRDDKFDGVSFERGAGGAPLLHGCVVCFECRLWNEYDGGDHVIFVGQVVAIQSSEGDALLFERGRYAVAGAHPGLDD